MIDALLLKEIRKRELWPALVRHQKYSPDQPRDDIGRWTDEGVSVGGGVPQRRHPITSIDEAIELLGNGQGVEFERPEQVVTLIHKLRDVVRKAEQEGQPAKVYDITKVSVQGTNLFAKYNVNIPRKEMPQLKGVPKPGSPADRLYGKDKKGRVDLTFPYLGELNKHAIGVEKVSIRADRIRPAQNQIDGGKVSKILHEYEKHGIPDRSFYVSKDHYVVDGHHHWAAQVTLQLENTKTPIYTKTYRVGEKILPLLKRTKEYTLRMGVGAQDIGKGWKYSPDQPRDDQGQWTDVGGGGFSVEGVAVEPGSVAARVAATEALYEYQNYAYGKLNESLRHGKELDEKGKWFVAAIDSKFAEEEAKAVRVWRGDGAGLSATLFENDPLPAAFKVRASEFGQPNNPAIKDAERLLNQKYAGKVFADKAYVSTTTSQKLAMDKFVPGSLEVSRYGAVGLVEITGKSKAIDMDKVTGRRTSEKERLLPRSSAFKIESVSIQPHPDGERLYLAWKVKVQ